MGHFTFENPWWGDLNTEALGIVVSKKRIRNLPARDVTNIHVPGRSGDILIDTASYQNVEVSYECSTQNIAAIAEMKRRIASAGYLESSVTPRSGYRLLTDSWTAGAERFAVCVNAIELEEVIANRFHTFTVVFNCKPQIYYQRDAAGASFLVAPTVTAPSSMTLTAPSMPIVGGLPKLEIYAAGDVTLGFEANPSGPQLTGLVLAPYHAAAGGNPAYYDRPSAVIDSEAMVCYRTTAGGDRVNVDIPFFPVLKKASNLVSLFGSQLRGATCYPRWYTL